LLKKIKSKSGKNIDKLISSTQKRFESAMDDDFNTGLALKAIYGFISSLKMLMKEEKLNAHDAKKASRLMLDFDRVLAILPKEVKHERK